MDGRLSLDRENDVLVPHSDARSRAARLKRYDLHSVLRLRKTSLLPDAWAIVGPFEYSVPDPLAPFGGIREVLHTSPDLQKIVADLPSLNSACWGDGSAQQTCDGSVAEMLQSVQRFPTEVGPGGQTLWGVAVTNHTENAVSVDFKAFGPLETAPQLAKQQMQEKPQQQQQQHQQQQQNKTAQMLRRVAGAPGRAALAYEFDQDAVDTWSGGGWAIAEFTLQHDSSLLAQCSHEFGVGLGSSMLYDADTYGELRAVRSLHLKAGSHPLFVRFTESPFWCDVFEDSAAARAAITGVADESNGTAPLVALRDKSTSYVVNGSLVSPHVAIPMLNTAESPIQVVKANVTGLPGNPLVAEVAGDKPAIISGQTFIVSLSLIQTEQPLVCKEDSDADDTDDSWSGTLNFTVSLLNSADKVVGIARLVIRCRPSAERGFVVTFPDWDGSVQEMWVAPPNLTGLPNQSCPPVGCPVLLSLHGASVDIGPVWGQSYEINGTGFPYPAWLVQPSNRFRWGSDWEKQGLDNALSSLIYVQGTTPTASDPNRSRVDLSRILITGHSMGGHGCMVFAAHFPDTVFAAVCASGWPTLEGYPGGTSSSPMLDAAKEGVVREGASEHGADFLASNLVGMNMMLIYGSQDTTVSPRQSRHMGRLVQSAGVNAGGAENSVVTEELKGVEHWFVQNQPKQVQFYTDALTSAFEVLDVIPQQLPEQFEYIVTNPATFGSRGCLRVLEKEEPSLPAHFKVTRCADEACQATEGHTSTLPAANPATAMWDVKTSNVWRFAYRWPAAVESVRRPTMLRIDGQLFSELNITAQQLFCRTAESSNDGRQPWEVCTQQGAKNEASAAAAAADRLGSKSPMSMALRRSEVCIVHGNGPEERAQAVALANRMYFVSRYMVPVISAIIAEKTPDSPIVADAKRCEHAANLVLIGTPASNPWVAKLKCAFPYVKFPASGEGSANGFAIKEQMYLGNRTGLLALGALPSGHLALLVHGSDKEGLADAARAVPVSAGAMDADFLVTGPEYRWKGKGGLLAAGFIDRNGAVAATGSWLEPETGYHQTLDQSAFEATSACKLDLQSGGRGLGGGFSALIFAVCVRAVLGVVASNNG